MKKRLLSLLLCLCMLLPLVSALDLTVFAATEKFTVTNMNGEETTTFTYGEPIMITPLVGEGKDWIGIAKKGDVSKGSIRYKYIATNGAASANDKRVGAEGLGLNKAFDIRTGAVTEDAAKFALSDIGEGTWTVFWVANNGGAGSYDTASAVDITVTAGPMTVNKTTFVVGEPILVTAKKQANTKEKSWYGIVPCDDNGTPKKSFGTIIWRDADDTQDDLRDTKNDTGRTGAFSKGADCATWMNDPARKVDWGGEVSKKHITSLPAGVYWLVYCWDSRTLYESQATADRDKIVTHAIQIRIEPCIEAKESYKYGEPIHITVHTPAASCAVFIAPKHEDVHTNYWSIRWQTVANAGTTTFDIRQSGTSGNYPHLWQLPPGEYSLYMVFAPDNKATAANHATRVNIVICDDAPLPPANAVYQFDKTTGQAAGMLTVTLDESGLANTYNKATHILTYWGDENGNKLAAYTYIGLRKVTGNVTEIVMPNATVIPDEAKTLLVYTYNGAGTSKSCFKIDLPADRKVLSAADKGDLLSSFQIVSDVHAQDTQTNQFNVNIARMFEDIKLNDPNTAGIFVAGDAVNDGRPVEYENLLELWEQSGLDAPFLFVSGNHEWKLGDANNSYTKDYEEEKERYLHYLNQFLSASGKENIENGKPYYDLWINGFHYIFLGSEAPITHAYLSDAQLNWLDAMLAEDRDANRPSFILIHQGLYNTIDGTMPRQDWDGVIAGDAAYQAWSKSGVWKTRGQYEQGLRDILRKYPEAMMFSGHTHWDMTEYNNYYDPTAPTDPTNAVPNYLFNTAAVAYICTGYYDDGVSYEYSEGWYAQTYTLYGETHLKWDDSKGYYLRVYENCIEIYGREFSSSQWVPNAMYRINKTAAIEKNEHEASKPCGNECIYCGELFTPANPHTSEIPCSSVCKWCGGAATPTAQHQGEHPCSTVCRICNESMTPAAQHERRYECSTECMHCGEALPASTGHRSAEGKPCSTECIYCHQTYDPGVAHQGLHPCSATCKKCGESMTPIAQHTRQHECSTACKWCGTPVPGNKVHAGLYDCSVTCKYGCGTAVTPKSEHVGESCTSTMCAVCNGAMTPAGHHGVHACSDKCAACGEAITPAAHTPGDWVTTKAATETAEGEQKRTCTVCGKTVDTRATDKLAASADPNAAGDGKDADTASGGSAVVIVVIVVAVVAVAGGATAFVVIKKKKSE